MPALLQPLLMELHSLYATNVPRELPGGEDALTAARTGSPLDAITFLIVYLAGALNTGSRYTMTVILTDPTDPHCALTQNRNPVCHRCERS